MKTTTTPKKINLPSNSKKNIIKYVLLPILIVFLFSYNSIAQTNICKAKLQVEKNRNSRSVPPEGTQYLLEISNESSQTSKYVLSATNINTSCSNNDGSSTSNNVNLSISFTDLDSNSISEITINSGETKMFLVQIKSPSGTPYNRWNCTQINATSSNCSNYSISTVLHTLVSNPNEE